MEEETEWEEETEAEFLQGYSCGWILGNKVPQMRHLQRRIPQNSAKIFLLGFGPIPKLFMWRKA